MHQNFRTTSSIIYRLQNSENNNINTINIHYITQILLNTIYQLFSVIIIIIIYSFKLYFMVNVVYVIIFRQTFSGKHGYHTKYSVVIPSTFLLNLLNIQYIYVKIIKIQIKQ